MFIEYLSQLPEDIRNRLLHLLYDDNCHLARFAMRKNLINLNEVTKMFAAIKKSIDKFHFGNHVDKWCLEFCNPYAHAELNNVNAVVCEQLFRDVNSHKNCKSMNEAKYFLFWLYMLDLHKLDVEGMADCVPDPMSAYRWEQVSVREVDLTDVRKMVVDVEQPDVDVVTQAMEKISIHKNFSCKSCGAEYESEGFLERHMTEKHKCDGRLFQCNECDKILSSRRNLDKHILNTHRKCNLCKEIFEDNAVLMLHKKVHTTCDVCGGCFSTKYVLDRHIKSHELMSTFYMRLL